MENVYKIKFMLSFWIRILGLASIKIKIKCLYENSNIPRYKDIKTILD